MDHLEEFMGDSGSRQQAGLTIDVKRILYRCLRFWYIIVLSLLVAIAIAFFRNRYTQRVYPVTTSIIIREANELAGGGELLYTNALVEQYRNYKNEPYIIRSYPLIEKVVTDLNFHLSFYQEGYFMTSEAYGYMPIAASLLSTKSFGARLLFKIVDDDRFTLEEFGDQSGAPTAFNFNDTIDFKDHRLVFTKREGRAFSTYVDVPFLMTISNPRQIAARYVGKLGVDWAEPGSGVIDLAVAGTIPQKEIDFLNGLVRHYQENDLMRKNEAADRAIRFIEDQLTKISDSLKIFERRLEQFKSEHVVTNLTAEAQRLYQKVESFELQKTEVIVRENYYQYLTDYIKGSDNLDQIILPSSIGIQDPVLTGLINQMVQIQMELKLYLGKERNESVPVQQRRTRITEIKKDILEAVNTLRSTDKIKLDYLNSQIKGAERELNYLPLAERQLITIQRNYNLLENLYVFLLQKHSEAGISKASNVSDITEVNPPMAGGAITPRTTQNYVVFGMTGLLLPLLVFTLMELFNSKVQSKEDVEKLTDIPFTGGIGHKEAESNLAVFKAPKSSIAEAFRSLRSNLNYFIGKKEKALFLVTSAIAGEGKTFTSVNIGSVLALSGKKVVIVGADMRRPKLFADFGLHNDVGLSNYLAGLGSYDSIIQHTSYENLDLISGGPVPPNPSELLLTSAMDQFIDECKKRYDYVIVDTPPLAIVTDAFALAGHADHTVFVVRQNYTPKDLLVIMQDYYSKGRLKNISIVLNDIKRSGPGYGYSYNYGYGYGYRYGSGSTKNGYGYYDETA